MSRRVADHLRNNAYGLIAIFIALSMPNEFRTDT